MKAVRMRADARVADRDDRVLLQPNTDPIVMASSDGLQPTCSSCLDTVL